jgi:predicted deacetylase
MKLILDISEEEFSTLSSICKSINQVNQQNLSVTNYLEAMINQEVQLQKEIESNYCILLSSKER